MVKGLLIRSKGPLGVVMTQDGRFVRVLLTGGNRALGQEVMGRELHFPSMTRGLAVASLLLVIMIGVWAKIMSVPAAAAYVALDINPSVELTVDQVGQVIQCRGLDDDGQKLLKQVVLDKVEIYRALDLLVQGAVQQHYLNEINNVVLATVTPIKEYSVVDEEKLKDSVSQAVTGLPVSVKIITEVATPQERQQATDKGISVGRYLIYQGSTRQGAPLTIEDVKNKGLGQLEKEKGWQIEQVLPHARYNIRAKHQPGKGDNNETSDKQKLLNKVPPGQVKKEQPHLPPGKQTNPAMESGKQVIEEKQQMIKDKDEKADEITSERRVDRHQSQLNQNKNENKDTPDDHLKKDSPGLDKKPTPNHGHDKK